MRTTKVCDCCMQKFHLTQTDWVKLDFAGRVAYMLCPNCGLAIERLLFGRTDDI